MRTALVKETRQKKRLPPPYLDPEPQWEDLQGILARIASGALQGFSRMSRKTDADMKLLKRLLDKLVSTYTEAPGKYRGNPIWSTGAERSYKKWGEKIWEAPNKRCRRIVPDEYRVVHKYVVPRKYLISKLLNVVKPTERRVGKLLRQSALAAVVTQEENGRLKQQDNVFSNCLISDPWVRYNNAGIKIVNHRGLSEQLRRNFHPDVLTKR